MRLIALTCSLIALMLLPSISEAADEYRVGARDVLEIRVFDEEDLSKEAVVHENGTIGFPLIGAVAVTGHTSAEIEQLIRTRLAERYLVDPQVFVQVKEYRSRKAVVLGMVKEPGPYSLSGRTTVLDLVSQAGGVLENAARSLVLVRGGNRTSGPPAITSETEPVLIDAHRLLRFGEATLNLVVGDGDILFVPRSDGVYVYGEVKKPGVVPYREGLTVLQAVSLAEGLTNKANDGKVQVIRSQNGKERKMRINLGKVVDNKESDLRLQPEDIVVVPQSFF